MTTLIGINNQKLDSAVECIIVHWMFETYDYQGYEPIDTGSNMADSESNFCQNCGKHLQYCKCWAEAMAKEDRCSACGLPCVICDCNPLNKPLSMEEEEMIEAAESAYMTKKEEKNDIWAEVDFDDCPF